MPGALAISVQDSPMRRLFAAMGPEGRRACHHAMAYALLVLCRKHLARAAASRHKTAARLGAAPTGHLEEAARTMLIQADADHGAVEVRSPGFARALGPLTVRARRAKALTIPLDRVAHGRRAAELKRMGWSLFRAPGPALRGILLGKGPSGEVRALYALRPSVTLPHDPGLLPKHEALAQTAKAALAQRLQSALRRTAAQG